MLEIWTQEQEAANLSRLFEGVRNKAAFAREFNIPGGASMLSQHCSGHRPMSLEAATAYAKGFGCSIEQISPRLAKKVGEAHETRPSMVDLFDPVTKHFDFPKEHKSKFDLMNRLTELDEVIDKVEDSARTQLKPLLSRLIDEQQAINLDEHPDLIAIRTVKMRLRAGVTGFSIESDQSDGTPIFFRAAWLDERGYKPSNLVAIKVQGASMEPTLYQGDMVVINTSDTEPKDGKAFAVNYEGEAMIKRMVRDSGVWWLSSDNLDQRKYVRKECAEGSCLVIGRVIHRQSEEI